MALWNTGRPRAAGMMPPQQACGTNLCTTKNWPRGCGTGIPARRGLVPRDEQGQRMPELVIDRGSPGLQRNRVEHAAQRVRSECAEDHGQCATERAR